MNERFKQLWEKAAQAAAVYPSGQNNSWKTQVNFMEKFAELIVQECLDIVNRKDYSYHEADPLWETSQLIKEHFGVEK